jgi:PAS domain S-box-containing protein
LAFRGSKDSPVQRGAARRLVEQKIRDGRVNRSFGLRAALSFLVLIAIAPVFGVVVQASLTEQQNRLDRAEASLESLVELGAAHQERLVEGARQMLTAIAYAPPVYQDDLAACATYMKRLQAQYPQAYGTFGLLDPQGRLTCRGTAPPNAVASNDRPFFRAAVATGRFSIGEYTVSRASGRQVLPFGFPVYRDDNGSLRGVVYVALDIALADEHLRKLTISPDVSLVVADRNAVVLASAGAHALPVGARVPEAVFGPGSSGTRPLSGRRIDAKGNEWLFAVQPVGRAAEGGLFVAGLVSTADVLAPAAQRLQMQLGALTLISVLAALAAWLFGDRVVARPIGRLLARVDALAREELRLDAPPPAGRLREFDELDRRFYEMAQRLAERSVQRDGAMAEMAGQKNLLESVLESMGEGVLVVDRRGRFMHANAAAHAIMPGAIEFTRQRNPDWGLAGDWGLFQPDGTSVPRREGTAARVLAGEGADNFRYLVKGRLSGGPARIVQGQARTLRSPEGEQYGTVVVFADITSTYRAEQALRESEQRYRTLFDANPHPMWVYDLETLGFLTVNDAAVAHYGYSREEFLAMTISQIRPAEDVEPMLRAVSDEAQVHSPAAWRHRRKDGTLIHVEISSHTLDYGGRKARMVLAHDVTQRLLAQEALEHLNQTLERRVHERTRELAVSNSELESFAYSVSHDLRAPLQVIDGFGRALLARTEIQLDERARHFLARIRDNTRQMGELIDDLLSLAHVTRAEIRSERVNLAPKAAQIVERLRQRDPERDVTVDIDDDVTCRGDARLLAIVLENLVENAWKFTARTPGARICIGRTAGRGGEDVIFVEDNGAGFDMAYAAKLFNAFQRLHAASEFPGTGIGLATVHRIVTRHGGRVWADARPGQGATFHFTLEAGARDEEQQPDSPGRGQPRPPGTHPHDAGREQCAQ